MSFERVLIFQRGHEITSRLPGQRATTATQATARQMLEQVEKMRPAVVIIQLEAAPAPLVRAVELIMSEVPTPILLIGGAEHRALALDLMKRGALEVTELPTGEDTHFAPQLEKQVALLSTIKVVKHTLGSRRKTSNRLPSLRLPFPVIAIASSLGGPRALAALLSAMPPHFRAAICVCQHITTGFTGELARWLSAETGHPVHEAKHGARVVQGECFIAPSNAHLTVNAAGVMQLDHSEPVGGFKPAADVLLKSVARAFGGKGIGVVLTGMGSDGASGLLEIRKAGGHTVTQDEDTCAVYGMPAAAVKLGAAELVLPLHDIAGQLQEWLS